MNKGKNKKNSEFILIESFLVYLQNNLDKIESFINELKTCEDLIEQRFKIVRFMYDCFNENKTAQSAKFKKMLRECNAQRHINTVRQQLEKQPVRNIIENIAQIISQSLFDKEKKKTYLERLSKIDIQLIEDACQIAITGITSMDIKYIVCFVANLEVKDISWIFNVEATSVHKVRYRIRKKFAKEDLFRTIL